MRRISTLVFISLLTCTLSAQESLSSANLYGRIDYKDVLGYQAEYLNKFYGQNVYKIDELVNGKEYVPYYFRPDFRPLLFIDRRHESSLTIKGRRYDSLDLDYDTFKDELIYSDYTKFIDYKVFSICLNKDLIDGFTFYFGPDSLAFKYFTPERDLNFSLPEGFYEEVYNRKSKFIIKHRSYLEIKDGLEEYSYSPLYFIMINGSYSKITNKRMFLKLFDDKSDEIKKFMRTRRINIEKAGKNEISFVLKYYDSLISSAR
jgi:hypothetical protein